MLGSSCLVCDGYIERVFAWVMHYPVCSQVCKDEWEDLTPMEKQRYLECERALHAMYLD